MPKRNCIINNRSLITASNIAIRLASKGDQGRKRCIMGGAPRSAYLALNTILLSLFRFLYVPQFGTDRYSKGRKQSPTHIS